MSGREGAGSPERQGEVKPGGILPALGAEVRGCFQGAFGHPTPCHLCHMESGEGTEFGTSTLKAFGGHWGP